MSSLQERLRRLRKDTGVVPEAAAEPAASGTPPLAPTLAERIRRLSPGRAGVRVQRVPDPAALAEALGADILAPGVLRLERRRPLAERHGRIQPGQCVAALPDLVCDGLGGASDPAGWAFLDTETSGLAGGTGTWVFCCGIGRICGEALVLRQYLLTRLDAEPAFIDLVADELAATRLLISYNGKTFDLPLLQTRLQLAAPGRLAQALPAERAHLDLLHPVRRAFANRWSDCRLLTCEERLLGLVRSDDLPGAEAPAAWLDWLRHGDGRRLAAVLRHNRTDLISLAALIPSLAAVEQDPCAHGADAAAIARSLLRRGHPDRALRVLQSAAPALDGAATLLLAGLLRRSGDWTAAAALWQRAADLGHGAALEQLAKYHEHVSGDLQAALGLAQRLAPSSMRDHRCSRLRRKLARAEDAAHPSAGTAHP